ncbi:hypothetical protein R3P38DRAFT_3254063 [Favolaschia claudopus]|uniref:F-box domain-containing protein n=1 Tax=Favolaschia claudopus TaxID=2862362 RepID=A0AAW0DV24_9AGAR
MAQNPLDVQELLDRCIGPLSESMPTLLSCSLVARSWVNPAQSRIFATSPHRIRTLGYHNANIGTVISQFCDALRDSPHLIHHVRTLHVFTDDTISESAPGIGEKLCSIIFTRLERLYFYSSSWTTLEWHNLSLVHLQRLVSLPSLDSLMLYVPANSFPFFEPLFPHLSPTIKHLNLHCIRWNADDMPVSSDNAPIIQLKSLVLSVMESVGPIQSLPSTRMFSPFDFSHLWGLQISRFSFHVLWPTLPEETKQSIRILDIYLQARFPPDVDLSAFPSLSALRIDAYSHPVLVSALASGLSRSVDTVVIGHECSAINIDGATLDNILGSFSQDFSVVFESEDYTLEVYATRYPILASQNRLSVTSRVGRQNGWFTEMVM